MVESSFGTAVGGEVRAVVTVAIVTYCSSAELPACLNSLLASDIPIKVVVIDNGSTDGTLELARKYAAKYSNVAVVASGGNIGLSAGNNVVIPYLEGDYALMLNPDTVVAPTTLSTLVELMESDRQVGVVGPKCVYEDGTPHTSYHRAWNFWHLFVWRVVPYSLVRKLYDTYARYRETEVDFVSGACLLVRSQLFREVNGYDPYYFLTVEDVCDLCRRIRQRGFKILFTPRAQITHLCGRSGAHVPYLSTLEGYKGDVYHFRKHHGKLAGYLAFSLVVFACFTKVVMSFLNIVVRRRAVDTQNFNVYWKIFPLLLSRGPKIAYSPER
jgi:GT2 family glycosyltransferase